jgi:hypothetical protein
MAKLGKTFRITPAGKVAKAKRRLSVSEHIRQKKSKRVRVVRRGTT